MSRARSAYAALQRGTAFLRSTATSRNVSAPPMVAGNALAELDQLLRVLIVQAARDRHVGLSACSRGNADRLTALCGAHSDGNRLGALLRSTTCLRRHDGRARQADRRGCGFMTVGWSNPGALGLHRIELGAGIVPSTEQMNDVCAFYDRLALRVLDDRRHNGPVIQPHGLARLAA